MIGGIELNGPWEGRRTTGRAFLNIIFDKKAETFQEVIEHYVLPGTTIWTDGHASYVKALNEHPDYKHESVIHRNAEFVRRNAQGIKVSTNAIEGMFFRTQSTTSSENNQNK